MFPLGIMSRVLFWKVEASVSVVGPSSMYEEYGLARFFGSSVFLEGPFVTTVFWSSFRPLSVFNPTAVKLRPERRPHACLHPAVYHAACLKHTCGRLQPSSTYVRLCTKYDPQKQTNVVIALVSVFFHELNRVGGREGAPGTQTHLQDTGFVSIRQRETAAVEKKLTPRRQGEA